MARELFPKILRRCEQSLLNVNYSCRKAKPYKNDQSEFLLPGVMLNV